jgi:hypothetical protein
MQLTKISPFLYASFLITLENQARLCCTLTGVTSRRGQPNGLSLSSPLMVLEIDLWVYEDNARTKYNDHCHHAAHLKDTDEMPLKVYQVLNNTYKVILYKSFTTSWAKCIYSTNEIWIIYTSYWYKWGAMICPKLCLKASSETRGSSRR